MDLLQGYGSSSDDDSVSSNHAQPSAKTNNTSSQLSTKRGKRILSLGAVLPPEIFDRLTRPADADTSSTSSFEDGDIQQGVSKKRKRALKNRDDENDNYIASSSKLPNGNSGGVDRTQLNSFLSELRSAPMEKKNGNNAKSNNTQSEDNRSEKLGMAFMSYTETKHNSNEVVDVHAVKLSAPQSTTGDSNLQRKSAAPPSLSFSRISTAAPIVPIPQNHNNIPEYPQETQETRASVSHTNNNDDFNANNTTVKSRKQRREEERALRSGAIFQNPNSSTTEIHQPSPTEFAPTAHAAAVASRAARYRGLGSGSGGSGSVNNISMYDPKAGGDVAGQGITGKHRSKHQINSLMANAISLEAHRAAEAELSRIGGGQKGGSNRADAKRKYGW